MAKMIDLTGRHFGPWVVINREGGNIYGVKWRCRCQICGAEKIIESRRLRRGTLFQCPNCRTRN